MLPPNFRTAEISKGRITAWVVCLSLLMAVNIGFLIRKSNEGNRLSVVRDETERAEKAKDAKDKEKAAATTARLMAEAKATAARDRLTKAAAQLASIPGLKNAAGGKGYLKGKVVIIDKDDGGTIDSLNSSLPEVLRANSPEEVGTVVWLNWNEERVGTYQGGGGAYVYTCVMTIIDRTSSSKVAVKRFRGGDPPYITYSHSGYGSRPDIISYLTNLPRR
jgi:hypothetical protein